MSPLVKYAIGACRFQFKAAPIAPIACDDWPAETDLVAFARRHRISGILASYAVACADPAGPRPSLLAADAHLNAQHGLRSAAACAAIHSAFAGAGIDHLFLKGLAIAALVYRDPFVKMSWDIDLLVAEGDVTAAADVLERLGYTLVYPASGDRARLSRWHARRKESTWTNGSGLFVELHSRLADSSALIPSIGLDSPRQRVEVVSGIALETFATVPLFAYLCVHGASSAWFRLKWVADLAGMLAPLSGEAIECLHCEAVRLGAGRAAAQALLVVDHLFVLPLDERFRQNLTSPVNRLLVAAALRQLFDPAEPTERRFGTVGIHASQWLLKPGVGFALGEARRQVGTALINRTAP